MPVKIKSTSGSVTLDAQNVSGDQTLTVPSLSGGKTLLTTDGDGSSLTGVGVDGIVSSANATAITIDSSERVSIKTTANPHNADLHVKNGLTVADGTLVISKPDNNTRNWRFLPNNALYDLDIQCTTGTNTSETGQATAYTSILELRHDGRGLSQFTAKAWAAAENTGTPSMHDSHNISSITDMSTGSIQFNYLNNISASSAGACSVKPSNDNLGADTHMYTRSASHQTIFHYENGTLRDSMYIEFVVFGD